jgi:hypothetical protein
MNASKNSTHQTAIKLTHVLGYFPSSNGKKTAFRKLAVILSSEESIKLKLLG